MKTLAMGLGLVSCACALAMPAAAATNLLQNGGFETPVNYFSTYSGTQIPGWTVTTNNVDIGSNAIYGSSTYAPEGVQWLDLVGSGTTGAIAQSFATTIGANYAISFLYANNPDFPQATARVDVGGLTTVLTANLSHAGSTTSTGNWLAYGSTFIADATTTTLTFTDTSHDRNAGLYLDGVSVSAAPPIVTAAVPEPATWMLSIVGFGLVGSTLRAKSRRGSFARI